MNGQQPTNACMQYGTQFWIAENGSWNGFVPSVVEHTISCSAKENTFCWRGSSLAQNNKENAATASIAATTATSPYRVDIDTDIPLAC